MKRENLIELTGVLLIIIALVIFDINVTHIMQQVDALHHSCIQECIKINAQEGLGICVC